MTKLGDFFFCSYMDSQNLISNFFKKKIYFLGFHAVVLVKSFPLMHQLLGTVGLITISFLGTSQNQIRPFLKGKSNFWIYIL